MGAIDQRVRATSGSLPPLDITVHIKSDYGIDVRFLDTDSISPALQRQFLAAAYRIEGAVIGDVADWHLQDFDISGCLGQNGGTSLLNEFVDDIIIYARVMNIDGRGGIVAGSGPCVVRQGASDKIPIVSVVILDRSDLDTLAAIGSVQDVMTHEMIHALGFGTLWGTCTLCHDYVRGSGTSDPRYVGAAADFPCYHLGGTALCAGGIPLENIGGAGTVEAHWRESTFDTELLTGFVDPAPNPLSMMTIAALADLGYAVQYEDSDSYSLPPPAFGLRAPDNSVARTAPLRELLTGVPLYGVDRAGKRTLVRAPH